ncbi:Uncharacterized protein HZ326_0813 [Fusarium oxysporum f. sp. albedinis]|nr:Uncharacterized protein HZ326_0813 [Fusarium oxysporum f. sp. albedinis]
MRELSSSERKMMEEEKSRNQSRIPLFFCCSDASMFATLPQVEVGSACHLANALPLPRDQIDSPIIKIHRTLNR